MALWKRALLALVLVLSAAVALAPSTGPKRTIPRGVRVAGVNMAGLDAGQARQQIISRFAAPLRFRKGNRRWSVSTARLGLAVAATDAVSRAFRARSGDDIQVETEADRAQIRSYVRALDKRFGRPAKNAELIGFRNGRPDISRSEWGRAVRRGTMTNAIARTIRKRIRPRLPLVMKPVKPAVSRAKFGPVVVIFRGSNRLELFDGNPWWRPPDSDWAKGLKPIPPGPGNPLGTRWMGLDASGVGIHGTPDAASIGYSASHGCIRMYIPDATWLFDHVRIGTSVLIVPE
jgi:hypothetical protein